MVLVAEAREVTAKTSNASNEIFLMSSFLNLGLMSLDISAATNHAARHSLNHGLKCVPVQQNCALKRTAIPEMGTCVRIQRLWKVLVVGGTVC